MLEATFERLALTEFSLVGLSMGGGLSIGYAARRPQQVRSIALFEPGGLALRYDRQFLTWLYVHTPGTRRLLSRHFRRKSPQALLKTLHSLFVGGSTPTDPERLVSILKQEVDAKAEHADPDLDDWQIDMISDRGPFAPAWNLLDEIPRLECPSLWLGGTDSTLVRQPDLQRAVDLAGPRARLLMIPGAGHLLPLERPAAANAAVVAFLDETSQPHQAG